MKILVLVHHELIPPEKFASKEEWASSPCNTEFDVVSHLKKAEHEVEVLGVKDELKPIRETVDKFKPKIVFNLLEEFAGEAEFDQNVVSYLELLDVPYTGCGPRGLMLARDKSLAKKILSYHKIPTPEFAVFKKRHKNFQLPDNLEFPLFVKALNEEASLGITQDSIVNTQEQLEERINYFRNNFSTDVIVENYIEGREIYVGVLGNLRLEVLPPQELFFKKTSERVPKIATSKVKWDLKYRKKYGISTGRAKNLSDELLQKIEGVCKDSYNALEINGYARMDLRIDEHENVYVIEANPNPDIGFQEELSDAFESTGKTYIELLEKVLSLGVSWNNI